MGTRSVIAKPDGDSWKGRYVHWDGYPDGVGLTVFEHLHSGALTPEQLIEKFVDSELVGWSILAGADLTLEPEWEGDRGDAPQSYTVRGETPDGPDGYWITATGDDGGTEYAYVVTPRELLVLGRTNADGTQAVGFFGLDAGTGWRLIAAVPYTATPQEYLAAIGVTVAE